MIDKAKNYFHTLQKYLTQQAIIIRYRQKVKKGHLSTDSEEYQKYAEAVWQSTYIKNKYEAFQRDFDSYFKPLLEEDARTHERKREQILLILQSPHPFVLIPQGEFEEALQQLADKKITETRLIKSEKPKEKVTKKLTSKQNTPQKENNTSDSNQEHKEQ